MKGFERYLVVIGLALVLCLTAVMSQDEVERARQVREQLSSISPPETPFDYIAFTLSGQNVTLSGFTVRPARAKDSVRAVTSLKWVEEVFDEIEVLPTTSTDRQIRLDALTILQNQIPRAFPRSWSNIRIKVNRGEVGLYGSIRPNEKFRLETSMVQIQARSFVKSVESFISVDEE
jgi:osmotically-inducible protein OsmY